MQYLIALMASVLVFDAAMAQQPLPLTEWRAEVDADLSKVPMTREAQITIMTMMQAYERRAQMQKAAEHKAVTQPPPETK